MLTSSFQLARGLGPRREQLLWQAGVTHHLYDVINLRTLMAYAYNALLERHVKRAPALAAHATPVFVPERGDVLYDVSKILLAL